jgi:anaerobic C4-dicarboxylate transporter
MQVAGRNRRSRANYRASQRSGFARAGIWLSYLALLGAIAAVVWGISCRSGDSCASWEVFLVVLAVVVWWILLEAVVGIAWIVMRIVKVLRR